MSNPLPAHDPAPQLALIQRLWDELKAIRKDPVKYEAVAERLRRESRAFLQMLDSDDPKP